MRSFTLSVLAAFAVFFTALSAHAQGEMSAVSPPGAWSGHCLNRPMEPVSSSIFSRELAREAKTAPKDSSWMASRMVAAPRTPGGTVRAWRGSNSVPGQSRAPVVCVDPNTPGCQVEMPDAPNHRAFGALAWDAVRMTDLFQGIPPADGEACEYPPYESGPRDGHAPASWRPPAA